MLVSRSPLCSVSREDTKSASTTSPASLVGHTGNKTSSYKQMLPLAGVVESHPTEILESQGVFRDLKTECG